VPPSCANGSPVSSTSFASRRHERSSDRKTLPSSDEPARLRAELAGLEDRLPALELAYDMVARDLHELRREKQGKWHKEQAEAVARAQRLVHEHGGRKAREALAEEQALLDWVDQPLGEFFGLAEAGQRAAVAQVRRDMQPLRALAGATKSLERRVRVNELLRGGGRYG
jgi:hypothetical protein